MTSMLALMDRLAMLRLAPASRDTDRLAEILCEELPFTVHEYPTGSEHNGWVIPQMWEVDRAHISKEGRVIYDGGLHPLGVIGYSQSFSGAVTLDELLPHLYSHVERLGDLVYHCNLYYRSGERDWGFSVLILLAENQRPNAEGLAAAGAFLNVGWHEDVSADDIAQALDSVLRCPDARARMRQRARALVDGRGAQRVVAAMTARAA